MGEYLTDEEREKAKRIIEEETDVEVDSVYTYDEIIEYYEDLLREMGISNRLLYYFDIEGLIEDEILSGYLDRMEIELNGREIKVYFFEA